MTHALQAVRVGDTQLRITRTFDAPPQRVFDAHFQPELIQSWMLGPPGWSMPVCEIRPEVGAAIRFHWEDEDGQNGFGLTGVVKELDPPHRSVHTELFGFEGATETVVETHYRPRGTGTELEVLITYSSKEAREAALSTGMTDGMEASYARIDALVTGS